MRFLVDESTGLSAAEHLRGQGHDALLVSEVMPQSADLDILNRAVQEQRVIVTNDKDFGELVFRESRSCPGVILLRLKDESAGNRVRILDAVLRQHSTEIAGNFLVATETQIRIRVVSGGSSEVLD